jgi:hypothetical protein
VNGKINGNIIFPKKQKANDILHIDQYSAVISLDQKSNYKLMLTGIHELPPTTSLYAVLPTTPQRIIFGPDTFDSLSKTRSGEGLADFHVRVNAAKMTATVAADGIVVYPKFECFYRIDIDHLNDGILNLIKHLAEQEKGVSPALQADYLQKFIFKLIMNQWEKTCTGKSSGLLLEQVPAKLFVDEFKKNGLSGWVYVSEIFQENQ